MKKNQSNPVASPAKAPAAPKPAPAAKLEASAPAPAPAVAVADPVPVVVAEAPPVVVAPVAPVASVAPVVVAEVPPVAAPVVLSPEEVAAREASQKQAEDGYRAQIGEAFVALVQDKTRAGLPRKDAVTVARRQIEYDLGGAPDEIKALAKTALDAAIAALPAK